MRLYSGKVPAIATEIVRTLLTGKDIEAQSPKEVEGDVAAVLNQYLADEREVNDRAKGLLERTGKGPTEYQRLRTLAADEKGIKLGDASHAKYKERQKKAVMRRLQLGGTGESPADTSSDPRKKK
ncbi:MAG: DUF507 family protein [Myxococcales bacterium]|nr:DUF507 family protein [Myxococcales bacterium]